MKRILKQSVVFIMVTSLLVGCEATRNANNSQKGAVIGAAGGAIIGGNYW